VPPITDALPEKQTRRRGDKGKADAEKGRQGENRRGDGRHEKQTRKSGDTEKTDAEKGRHGDAGMSNVS